MRTPLDKLLDDIHPSKTLDVRHDQAGDAINSFKNKNEHWDIRSDQEIHEFLYQCGAHVADSMLGCRFPPDVRHPLAWVVSSHLRDKYGARWMNDVARMVRNETSGALWTLVREIAYAYAEHFANREIGARVAELYPALNFEVQLELAREYLQKFAYLLPEDIVAGGPAMLVLARYHFLWTHPHRLRLYRRDPLGSDQTYG